MANLKRIVDVSIALNTSGISTQGFNTILIAGYHINSLNRVDIISDIDDLASMGIASTDEIYKAVAAVKSQKPGAKTVKLGRLTVDAATIGITAKNDTSYTVTVQYIDAATAEVKEEVYTHENQSGQASTIATGLAGKITSSKVTATASGDTVKLSIKADCAVKVSKYMTLTATPSDTAIADDMAMINAEDSDYYGVVLADKDADKILEMAAYIETRDAALFGVAKYDAGVALNASKSDILSQLNEKEYYRTFFYGAKLEGYEGDYVEAAIMSRCFAIKPGGETWALKSLAGVRTSAWTETEAQAIFNKNGNTYEKVRNVSVTQNGKVVAGEWIDVIRFRDWLIEEIKTRIFLFLKNADKIPYTDGGINGIGAQLRAALELGVDRGGIAPEEVDADGNANPAYVIELPLAADISTNQKASRTLTDVKFTARLAGAIHAVEVNGAFTYANLTTTDNNVA